MADRKLFMNIQIPADQVVEKLGVLLIAVVSGFAFQYGHELLHTIFGADLVGVLLVSTGIAALSVVGYLMWTQLTELQGSTGILSITAVSGWILHFASHAVEGLSAVAVVGEYMFWVGLIGSLLNYFLTEDGIWLYGDKY